MACCLSEVHEITTRSMMRLASRFLPALLLVASAVGAAAQQNTSTTRFPLPALPQAGSTWSSARTLDGNPGDSTLDLVFLQGEQASFVLNPFSHGPVWIGEVNSTPAIEVGVLEDPAQQADRILVLTQAGLELYEWGPHATGAFTGGFLPLAGWAGATAMWVREGEVGPLVLGLAADGTTLLRARPVSGSLQSLASVPVPAGIIDVACLDLDGDASDEYGVLTTSSLQMLESDGTVLSAFPTVGVSEFLLELGDPSDPVLGVHLFAPLWGGFHLLTLDLWGYRGYLQAPELGWSRGGAGDDNGDGNLDAVLIERATASIQAGDRKANWVRVAANGSLVQSSQSIEFTCDHPQETALPPQMVTTGDFDNDGDQDAAFFAVDEGLLHLAENQSVLAVEQLVQVLGCEVSDQEGITSMDFELRWGTSALDQMKPSDLLMEVWAQPEGPSTHFLKTKVDVETQPVPTWDPVHEQWVFFSGHVDFDATGYDPTYIVRVDLTPARTELSVTTRVGPTRSVFWSPDENTRNSLPSLLSDLIAGGNDPTNTTRVTSGAGGGSVPPSGGPPGT